MIDRILFSLPNYNHQQQSLVAVQKDASTCFVYTCFSGNLSTRASVFVELRRKSLTERIKEQTRTDGEIIEDRWNAFRASNSAEPIDNVGTRVAAAAAVDDSPAR